MSLEVTAGRQGAHHQARLRRRLRRPSAAPGHPEHGRGRPRRAPAARQATSRARPSSSTRTPMPAWTSTPPSRGRPSRRASVRWLGPRAATSASRAATPSCAGKASAAPAGPGTASSRRSSASHRATAPRASRGRRRRPSPPCRSPSIGDADVPRLPIGIGELDRVLGGGLVPGLADPAGRRAGDRQVDAPAPGRGRLVRGAGRRPRPLRDRRGIGRAGPAPGRPARAPRTARRRRASSVLAEHDVGRIVDAATTSGTGRSRSSIRSRRRRSTSSTGRPAASARSAHRPSG